LLAVGWARWKNRRVHADPNALSLEAFLDDLASARRSQGRLSVAGVTTACCAAQLEAQCREVLDYRKQAPGPYDVPTLIGQLRRVRARLLEFVERAVRVERAATCARALPGESLDDRLAQHAAREATATDLFTASVDAAALIAVVAALGRRVHVVRREIRGGAVTAETTSVMLAAASSCVIYVLDRSLRSVRSSRPELSGRAARALKRLLAVALVDAAPSTSPHDAASTVDRSRLN
jgi:hypothetical protein